MKCGIVLFILLWVSTSVSAFTLSEYNGRCGKVRTYLGPTDGKHGVSAADHYSDPHGGYIILDPTFIRGYSAHAIEFLYFHECGHRVLGHVNTPNHQYEVSADCYAARRFTKLYGRNRLHQTMNELVDLNTAERNKRIMNCR
jgi:hypothetical protein